MTNEEIQERLVTAIRTGVAGPQTVLRLGRYIESRIFIPDWMTEEQREGMKQMGIGLVLQVTFQLMGLPPGELVSISRITEDGEDYTEEQVAAGDIQNNIRAIVANKGDT